MKRYIYLECDHLAGRGYNKAIEVYRLKAGGFPELVGACYELNSASWAGYRCEARLIVSVAGGHKLIDNSIYKGFVSKSVQVRQLGEAA
jgi:hypothetical protein